jgi:hypothetical protein
MRLQYRRVLCDRTDCTRLAEFPVTERPPHPWLELQPPRVWFDLLPEGGVERRTKALLLFCSDEHLIEWIRTSIIATGIDAAGNERKVRIPTIRKAADKAGVPPAKTEAVAAT